jgi:hypothetical protein
MSETQSKSQCEGETQSGSRCSRPATEGNFCYQHRSSSIDRDNLSNAADQSSTIEWNTEGSGAQSGAIRDIRQNADDIADNVSRIGKAILSKRFDDAVEAVQSTVTTPTTTRGALVGVAAGSLLGPLGVFTGGAVGACIGFIITQKDGRAVAAARVDGEDIPKSAEINCISDTELLNCEPIRVAIEIAEDAEVDQSEWVGNTMLRERDMDTVESILDGFVPYDSDDTGRSYFVRNENDGSVFQIVFGVPQDE